MSVFGTFLLLVAAFIGTVMFFVNPGEKFVKWAEGKKVSEAKAELDDKIENDFGSVVLKGCGAVFFLLISLAYSFVIEPLAIIAALINKVGYMPIAYAMLVIVGLSWIMLARALMRNGKTQKSTVITEGGDQVDGILDEEMTLGGNPVWRGVKRVFYSLPTWYLWYLFFISIGAIQ